MIEAGEEIPVPRELDDIARDADVRESARLLVPATILSSRSTRINISLPEDLLREVDAYATRHGLTRSGLLARAARRAITEDAA
jgi:hypothetical protein